MILFKDIIQEREIKKTYDLSSAEKYFNECLDKYFPDGFTWKDKSLPNGYRELNQPKISFINNPKIAKKGGDFSPATNTIRVSARALALGNQKVIRDIVFHEAIHYIEGIFERMFGMKFRNHGGFFKAQMERINKAEGTDVVTIFMKSGDIPNEKIASFYIYLMQSNGTTEEKALAWSLKPIDTEQIVKYRNEMYDNIFVFSGFNLTRKKLKKEAPPKPTKKMMVTKLAVIQSTIERIASLYKRSFSPDKMNFYKLLATDKYDLLFIGMLDKAPNGISSQAMKA